MTRFLYIADTHLGAEGEGYQQQHRYPQRLEEIFDALRSLVSQLQGIDFVLHGGDMVDATTEQNISAAAEAFDCGVPLYLCLGNHDLTRPDAVQRWMALAPRFFPDAHPEYTIVTDDCVIHVAPNHWGEEPYYWKSEQHARLSDEQRARLDESLSASPDLPHVLLTHSPVHGLPVEQTGFAEPHHAPPPSFASSVADLAARHGNLRCVIGAHTHMNMCVEREGVRYVTVSSLVETPFELKVFEVRPDEMSMSTVSLGSHAGLVGKYDEARAFVQGRPEDRAFVMTLRRG